MGRAQRWGLLTSGVNGSGNDNDNAAKPGSSLDLILDTLPLSLGEDDRVVIADVTIEDDDGEWKITLNDDYIPRLRISSTYRDLIGTRSFIWSDPQRRWWHRNSPCSNATDVVLPPRRLI